MESHFSRIHAYLKVCNQPFKVWHFENLNLDITKIWAHCQICTFSCQICTFFVLLKKLSNLHLFLSNLHLFSHQKVVKSAPFFNIKWSKLLSQPLQGAFLALAGGFSSPCREPRPNLTQYKQILQQNRQKSTTHQAFSPKRPKKISKILKFLIFFQVTRNQKTLMISKNNNKKLLS